VTPSRRSIFQAPAVPLPSGSTIAAIPLARLAATDAGGRIDVIQSGSQHRRSSQSGAVRTAGERLLVDGKPAWEASLGDMLFGFLFDAVHHRGQLSTYLRPMGAKVPSIYGPSGDDPGA
jgi:hypothetical protein